MAAGERLAYLDGWRGMAITLVLLGHFGPWSSIGGLGVEVFFVLSGRLMAHILFVERYPLPVFFQRRLSRILPALLVMVLAVMALGWAMVRFLGVDPPVGWGDALLALTFTANYGPALGLSQASVLMHTWSLAVEEHAYVLLAVLALALGRSEKRAVPVLLLGFAFCVVNGLAQAAFRPLESWEHDIYWRTDVRAGSIFAGAALYLILRGRRVPAFVAPVALAVGLASDLGTPAITYTVGTLALATAVSSLDTAYPPLRAVASWLPLRVLGLWSFSLYLWQQPFYVAKGAGMLSVPLALAGAVVAGAASYYLIEQPARRYLNGLGSRSRGVDRVTPPASLPVSDPR
jgi:peptidoglycan/LPS O-acetylase OafA/YrhL